ncbi:MAG: hypothetical protein OQL09_06255 [Gammaproteobacteria bacterium]|nr:hypothetical protein [Gammaproteobacteria bacterium]
MMKINNSVLPVVFFAIGSMMASMSANATGFFSRMSGINYCSMTSNAAFKACKNEIRDDLWIGIGKCMNEDDDVREECLAEAKEELAEGRELCRDQFDAREEICELLGQQAYNPVINPDEFLDLNGMAANPNPFFPLLPGLTKTYQEGEETIVVTVTDQTKEILGVTCVVVRDTVSIDGELVEDTDDWLAQDIYGNVWYFGEISRNYEDGELVDLEGSWKAGVDGAKAGILMKAVPTVGDVYRQEFLLGDAEDMGEVISTSEYAASVPAANCSAGCVVTRDFLPIEPDVNEHKYYAPGIGHILSIDVETGDREELIDIVYP